MKKHILSVYEGNKPLKCCICNKGFTSDKDLKQHVTSVHEGKKPHKCGVCDTLWYILHDTFIIDEITLIS